MVVVFAQPALATIIRSCVPLAAAMMAVCSAVGLKVMVYYYPWNGGWAEGFGVRSAKRGTDLGPAGTLRPARRAKDRRLAALGAGGLESGVGAEGEGEGRASGGQGLRPFLKLGFDSRDEVGLVWDRVGAKGGERPGKVGSGHAGEEDLVPVGAAVGFRHVEHLSWTQGGRQAW